MKYVAVLTIVAILFLGMLTQNSLSYGAPTSEQKFKKLSGIGYSPHTKISPLTEPSISEQRISQDIRLLDPISNVFRLYELNTSTENIVEESSKLNKSVILSLSITGDITQIKEDIHQLSSISKTHTNIDGIVLDGYSDYDGNEVSLEGILEKQVSGIVVTEDQIRSFIKLIKDQDSNVKIGLALNEKDIIRHNSLIQDLDFIIYMAFPYWNGFDVKDSLEKISENYNSLKKKFPSMTIIIETGWPNKGKIICDAKPSNDNQYSFVTSFIDYATLHDIPYVIFSLFDQSWKRNIPNADDHAVCNIDTITQAEYSAENNWGLFNIDRTIKLHFYEYFNSNLIELVQPLETKDGYIMINSRIPIAAKSPIIDESVLDGDSVLVEITGEKDNKEHNVFLVNENQVIKSIKTQFPTTIVINSQYKDNFKNLNVIIDEDPKIIKQLDDWRLNPVFGDFEKMEVKFFKVPIGYAVCLDLMLNCNEIDINQPSSFPIDIYATLAITISVILATIGFFIRAQVGYILDNDGSDESGMDPSGEIKIVE